MQSKFHFVRCKAFAIITSMAILLSPMVHAYDDSDKARIEQKLDVIEDAMRSANAKPLIDSMPPRVFELLAEDTGIPATQLKSMVVSQSNALLGMGIKIDYRIDMDNASVRQTPSGREYVLIPTTLRLTQDGNTKTITEPLLALKDGEEWYVLRMQGAQSKALLVRLYPDFEGVTW